MAWGHKITISIYVEDGDQEFSGFILNGMALGAAEAARKAAARWRFGAVVDYVGASVEPIQEKPEDQG